MQSTTNTYLIRNEVKSNIQVKKTTVQENEDRNESKDVLQKSMEVIKKIAADQQAIRRGSGSAYSNVKSRVALNLKSQEKQKNLYKQIAQSQSSLEKVQEVLGELQSIQSKEKLGSQIKSSQKFITPSKERIAKKPKEILQTDQQKNDKIQIKQNYALPLKKNSLKKERSSVKAELSQDQIEEIMKALKQKFSKDLIPQLNQKTLQNAIKKEYNQIQLKTESDGPIQEEEFELEDKHNRYQQLTTSVHNRRSKIERKAVKETRAKSATKAFQSQLSSYSKSTLVNLQSNRSKQQDKLKSSQIQSRGSINRLYAHEVYLDEVVNTVHKTDSKVKPGQMNIFNFHDPNTSSQKDIQMESIERVRKGIKEIQSILKDDGHGRTIIRNKTIREKTEQVQKEFDQLMDEMVNKRVQVRLDGSDNQLVLDDINSTYYEPKHKSPTRRLIQHKDSVQKHKQLLHDTFSKGEYSQTYCVSPGKSYVIEAQGGELPYEIAEKSPKKFYDQVLNQDIKRVSVSAGRVTSKMTKRELIKLFTAIKGKVITRIMNKIGPQFSEDIAKAIAPGSDIENQLLQMVKNQQVDLIDQGNQESINIQIDPLSELQVKEQKSFNKLETDVIKFVRRTSTLKEARLILLTQQL